MTAARVRACPICKREVAAREATPPNPAWPFCCERCRLIDLGKWFAEDYRVPADPADGEPKIEPED